MPTALSFITDYVRAVHLDRRRGALWPDVGAPLVHGEPTAAEADRSPAGQQQAGAD